MADSDVFYNKVYIIHIVKELLNILFDITDNDDNKWIDINECPPAKDGSYLVCTKKKTVCTARFYTSMNKFSSRLNDSIVAWMPLPKPISTIDNRKEYK